MAETLPSGAPLETAIHTTEKTPQELQQTRLKREKQHQKILSTQQRVESSKQGDEEKAEQLLSKNGVDKIALSTDPSIVSRTGARYIVDEKKPFLITFSDGKGLSFDGQQLRMVRTDGTTKVLPEDNFTRFVSIFLRDSKISRFQTEI